MQSKYNREESTFISRCGDECWGLYEAEVSLLACASLSYVLSVLESPRDLQFSEVTENSAIVHWTPPLSQVDGFKVSYQLSGGGDAFLCLLCPLPLHLTLCPPPQFLLASWVTF